MNFVKRKHQLTQALIHRLYHVDDGTNIDNWSLDGIKEVVADFI
jgi:hypothetical protein